MLLSLKELLGYELMATDGPVGRVHNFLFSDEDWAIRYLVVDTGPWIFGRKVLISPNVLQQPIWSSRRFPVALTREEVRTSPDIDLDDAKTVSRQYEEKLHQHYNWPAYWHMSSAIPGRPVYFPMHLFNRNITPGEEVVKSHLRSATEIIGYNVRTDQGDVGEVGDLIVQDEDWLIYYMIVDTDKWLDSGKQILVALEWIKDIKAPPEREIALDLTQEAIKSSPAFDPTQPVNRQYEEVLYDYFGRPKYWQVLSER